MKRENEVKQRDPEIAPEEELVPEDDTIIGKAFRWSLLVILGVVGLVALGFYLSREDAPQAAIREVEVDTPENLVQDAESLPEVRFTDITREAGIQFVHVNGARGEKMLPETMGGGVAFLDYDNDGDQDLLFVNSDVWPGDPAPSARRGMALYENDGSGRFQDATAAAGLNVTFYGMGVAAGDFDGDGWTDLFLTALGPNRLFRNERGRFRDVTAQAGVGGERDEWSSSAGFFDYDNDGDLDLFVGNYVRWTRQIDLDLNFTLNGRDRAYGPPTNFTGTYPYLYRNEGAGRFRDVSAEAGVQIENPVTGKPMAKALGLAPIDLDRDGWMDVVVANDTVQNFLFHNQGDGTFEEIGAFAGVGFDSHGSATGAMGIDAAHYRNSAWLALAVANFANEMTSLMVSQDDPLLYVDETATEGIGSPSRLSLSFGLFFFDYDLDGRLDLLQANGHLEEEINQVQKSQFYEQAAQLFWNSGPQAKSCFVQVPQDSAGDLSKPIVGRGAAYADIDGDGDLDVVLTQTGREALLLRNDQELGRHWLRIKLRGGKGNPEAIGAWVELTSNGITQRRQVMPTRSYLSQVELPLTFGLGDSTRIDSITVRWPDGSVEEVAPPQAVDTTLVVER